MPLFVAKALVEFLRRSEASRRRCYSLFRSPPIAIATFSPYTQISPTVPGGHSIQSGIDDADCRDCGAP